MTNEQSVRFEMLVRVREFGEEYKHLFQEGTEGREALAVVTATVAALEAQAKSKVTVVREGVDAKASSRQALVEHLESIARTARVIARDAPGFDAPFLLPKSRTDHNLLTSGRAFADAAGAETDRFVRLGMPPDFVTALVAAVTTLEQATRKLQAGRNGTAAARTAIASTLATGFAAAQKLEVFVANAAKHDPSILAVWERSRKVDYARRVRRPRHVSEADGEEQPTVQPATAPVTSAISPAEVTDIKAAS